MGPLLHLDQPRVVEGRNELPDRQPDPQRVVRQGLRLERVEAIRTALTEIEIALGELRRLRER